MTFKWPLIPLCRRQMKDVHKDAVWGNGLYHLWDTNAGHHDEFPQVAKKRGIKGKDLNMQFVVQVKGCPLRCEYCNVTKKGVHGDATIADPVEIMVNFKESTCKVFHLSGGAPAIYLEHWRELAERIPANKIFHSDFILVEREYKPEWLQGLDKKNFLFAVNLKSQKHLGINFDWPLALYNLSLLRDAGMNYYVTFTGMTNKEYEFYIRWMVNCGFGDCLRDSFRIPIKQYRSMTINKEIPRMLRIERK